MGVEIKLGIDPSEPEIGPGAILHIGLGEIKYLDVISGTDSGWTPVNFVDAARWIIEDRINHLEHLMFRLKMR